MLAEISGMDAVTLQPAAGAHGELTGMLMIRAFHRDRATPAGPKVLVPDSAHGTNPATAVDGRLPDGDGSVRCGRRRGPRRAAGALGPTDAPR